MKRWSIALCAAAGVTLCACGKSATDELVRADQALQAAMEANAYFYAQQPYAEAVSALSRARELANQGQHRAARKEARQARDLADTALKTSEQRRPEMEKEIPERLARINTSLAQQKETLKTAKAPEKSSMEQSIKDSEQMLTQVNDLMKDNRSGEVLFFLDILEMRLRVETEGPQAALPEPMRP